MNLNLIIFADFLFSLNTDSHSVPFFYGFFVRDSALTKNVSMEEDLYWFIDSNSNFIKNKIKVLDLHIKTIKIIKKNMPMNSK